MLTHKKVTEFLFYDPESGQFFWRMVEWPMTKVRVGDRAGYEGDRGYRLITICGEEYREHRLVWFWWKGKWPEGHIDHINGKRDDNRIANLREATNGQNRANSKPNKSNKFGLKGVRQIGSRFQGQVTINGKTTYLGTFDTPEEAHASYLKAIS
jgi:HNH endonuclease